MTKEVLSYVDVQRKEYDIRCRADTNTAEGFTRTGDGRVVQVLIGTGTIRFYNSEFIGDDDVAESVAKTLQTLRESVGYTRVPLSQA
jgi:hypothetical protein